MDKYHVAAFPLDDKGCGQYRIIKPFAGFRSNLLDVAVRQEVLPSDDAVIFQRPFTFGHLQAALAIKKAGKALILDIDDMFPVTDPESDAFELLQPGTPQMRILFACIQAADGIMVSTPELAEYYRPHTGGRVETMLNALDADDPAFETPLPRTGDGRLMLWGGGSRTHARNLRLIADAVAEAMARVADLRFAFCGPLDLRELFDTAPARTDQLAMTDFDTYMRIPSLADFALAPLEDTDFNACKSEIRLLESGIWSRPCVASPVGPHLRFHAKAPQGFCWRTRIRKRPGSKRSSGWPPTTTCASGPAPKPAARSCPITAWRPRMTSASCSCSTSWIASSEPPPPHRHRHV